MKKSTLAFLFMALGIIGVAMAVAFLIVYGISSFTNQTYMWLMVVGFVIAAVSGVISLLLFMKKDHEIGANSKVLDEPKKPH